MVAYTSGMSPPRGAWQKDHPRTFEKRSGFLAEAGDELVDRGGHRLDLADPDSRADW
jgi:hypothetical protein